MRPRRFKTSKKLPTAALWMATRVKRVATPLMAPAATKKLTTLSHLNPPCLSTRLDRRLRPLQSQAPAVATLLHLPMMVAAARRQPAKATRYKTAARQPPPMLDPRTRLPRHINAQTASQSANGGERRPSAKRRRLPSARRCERNLKRNGLQQRNWQRSERGRPRRRRFGDNPVRSGLPRTLIQSTIGTLAVAGGSPPFVLHGARLVLTASGAQVLL